MGKLASADVVVTPPLCLVAPGPFLMGSDAARDRHTRPDELPQHTVTLAGFELAQYPVTVAEYALANHTRAVPPPWQWDFQLARPDCPVVNVAWQDALRYAAWLTRATGARWRLPSEAEWEKAARGADGRIYPWGDEWDPTRAKGAGNGEERGVKPVGTHVGDASPYGARDLAGNVWEWCTSLYYPYPYDPDDGREDLAVPADIPDHLADERHARVMRGGSWEEGEICARAAMRGLHVPPWNYDSYIGFRVLRG
jgi:formylglycine-generating enzyme required for sulfatase activity